MGAICASTKNSTEYRTMEAADMMLYMNKQRTRDLIWYNL